MLPDAAADAPPVFFTIFAFLTRVDAVGAAARLRNHGNVMCTVVYYKSRYVYLKSNIIIIYCFSFVVVVVTTTASADAAADVATAAASTVVVNAAAPAAADTAHNAAA